MYLQLQISAADVRAIAKTYFAEKIGISRKDLVVISIMPCLAKKYECQREEFSTDGNRDVDYSISTRELAAFIKQSNIDLNNLEDEEFDSPMGESTGAAVIFGNTGGVIELLSVQLMNSIQVKSLKKSISWN